MNATVLGQLDRSVLNLHVATSFFAGLTFYSSFSYLIASPLWIDIILTLTGRSVEVSDNALIFNADIETEAVEPKERGKQTDPAAGDVVVGVGKNSEERVDSSAVALALPLLIFLASLVQFVTSFALTPINSSAAGACAFLVAWFDVLFQSSRIVGLYSIGVHLRKLGLQRTEAIVFAIGLFSLIGLIIGSIVVNFGFVGPIPDICYRKHSVGPSVALSAVAIAVETLCMVWLFRYMERAAGKHQRCKLARDFRVSRIMALLVFDFIGLVVNSIKPIMISSFIPSSVAALVLLVAFNRSTHIDAVRQSGAKPSRNSDANPKSNKQSLSRQPQPPPLPIKDNISYTASASILSKLIMSPSTILSEAQTLKVNEPKAWERVTDTPLTSTSRSLGLDQPSSQPSPGLAQPAPPKPEDAKGQLAQSLVQPIMSKELIMKHFSDNEPLATRKQVRGLPPRPTPRNSSPQSKRSQPSSNTIITKPQTLQRHSFSGESGKAMTMTSSIYGSDIIRPPPGAKVRDKMKVPEFPRLPNRVPAVPYSTSSSSEKQQPRPLPRPQPRPRASHAPVVKPKTTGRERGHDRTGSTSGDSWLSDTVPIMRAPALLPRFEFEGLREGWPMPPTRVPTPDEVKQIAERRQKKRQTRSRSRSRSHMQSSPATMASTPRRRIPPMQKPPPTRAVPPRPPRPEALYL